MAVALGASLSVAELLALATPVPSQSPTSTAEHLARRLALAAADAADADQWSVSVDGLDPITSQEEELVPRWLLEALNGGRPAAYRVTLPIRAGYRDLGIVRLVTIRPCGFRATHIARARAAVDRHAESLAAALSPQPRSSLRERNDRRLAPQPLPLAQATRPSVSGPRGEWREAATAGGPGR